MKNTVKTIRELQEKATSECADSHYEPTPKFYAMLRDMNLDYQVWTVCCGGMRIRVVSTDGVLISITPKASSVGRGHIRVVAAKAYASWEYGGIYYESDDYGRYRTVAAVNVVFEAWKNSQCNELDFYKILATSTCQCACCGAPLSDELSVSRGIGPECWKKVDHAKALAVVQNRRMKEEPINA